MSEHKALAIRALRLMRDADYGIDGTDSSEIEAAIDWVERQDDEGDDSLYDLTPEPPRVVMYDSAVKAICQGHEHRAILLKPSYTLNKAHAIADVQPYEFEGYPQGGVFVSFKITNDGDMGLDWIEFSDVNGYVGGCVVLNECGLIAWIACAVQGNGGNLTIFSD